jgi:hypothetical protein
MYFQTTKNFGESTPVKFILNKDNTIGIRLQQFNIYGTVSKTFSLIFCNFDIKTYAFIEATTNQYGIFLLNMICFDSDEKRQLPNNTLDFTVEVMQYSPEYVKKRSIMDLDK